MSNLCLDIGGWSGGAMVIKSHKKNIGFEADTLEMIRFACLVISIQQFPGFVTKSMLLAKSTYKIIMIKNTIY